MVAHRVCFSTHSSLSELERFVKHFAPKKVVPCVVPKRFRFQERLDQFQKTFSALLQRCGVISQKQEEEDVEEIDRDDQEDHGGESEEPEREGGKEGGDCEELEQEEGERGGESEVSSSRGEKRERQEEEEEDREREARVEENRQREPRVEEDSPWELEDSPRREDNLDDTPDLDELEEIAKAQNYPHHAQQAIRLHKRIRDWQEELRRREVETITID